jgi:hypothetical protein
MKEEIDHAEAAIAERDEKCKLDMERIIAKIASSDSFKIQV